MKSYCGIRGSVGVHRITVRLVGAEHILGQAMAMTGNYKKYKIITMTKEVYPKIGVGMATITYEVFE